MPRINNPKRLASRPASIILGELAIAAGVAGRTVALCFEDYSAPILCEMCRYLLHGLGTEGVVQIRSQADLKKLDKQISDVRLVLVQSPRVYAATAWAVQMFMPAEDIGTLGEQDPDNRRMHRFTGLSPEEQASLAHVRKAGLLREQHPALRRGTRSSVVVEDDFWVYKVIHEADEVYVVINRGAEKSWASP